MMNNFQIAKVMILNVVLILSSTVASADQGEALRQAARNNDLKQVQNLLKNGADVNSSDYSGRTALIHASRKGHLQVVRLLLHKGAEVNATNKDGLTALMEASMHAPETARLLLEQGAGVNAKSKGGWTALFYATEVGRPDSVRLLLEKGADVNSRDNKGETPLLHVVGGFNDLSGSYHNIVRLLLTKGADVNIEDQDDGLTALGTASLKGQSQIVALLKAYGATELGYGYEKMAFLFAAWRDDLKQIRNLLEKGVDVNAKPSEGWTALMLAAGEGRLDVVRLLLEKGADVNAKKTGEGRTALSEASSRGHFGVVRLLLENGADVNEKDNYGWTALDRAAAARHSEIEELLKAHGAKE